MSEPAPGSAGPAALAELRSVEKVYPNGVVALRGVDLTLGTGDVHAIVGENGAGKSTLVKILFGLEEPTAGTVLLEGREVHRHSPAAAMAAGIGMVHQHFQLLNSLTVAENLVLGDEPTRGPFFDDAAAARSVAELTRTLDAELDPRARVADLAVGDRQRLEILKALHRGARILILDEPTAVLTPQETDRLLESVQQLASTGIGVVLITHKLREVLDVATTVTVLRGGERIWTRPGTGLTGDVIAEAMVGGSVDRVVNEAASPGGDPVLRLDGVYTGGTGRVHLTGLDLAVRAGEIVGVAGVEGNGQDDLVDVIAGLRPAAGGDITLGDRSVTGLSPRRRRALGLAHIAADRMHRGVASGASVADNLAASRLALGPGLPDREALKTAAGEAVDRFGIRVGHTGDAVAALSGGNIQKVVVARELEDEPRFVLAAHPTRGVDLGAMAQIHRALLDCRENGSAILLVSSELDELRALADRLVVMHDGGIVARYDDVAAVTDTELGLAMAGTAGGQA